MRKILIALISLVAVIASPATAFAHAAVVSLNPAPNSNVSFMPKSIRITFSENLMQLQGKQINSLSLTYMKYSDLGIGISLTDVKVDGATISATVPDGQYRTGNYVVTYSIVSEDGHKVSESYRFSLHAFGSPLTTIAPKPVPAKGNGVLPLPIVGAISIAVIVAFFSALRARNRKK